MITVGQLRVDTSSATRSSTSGLVSAGIWIEAGSTNFPHVQWDDFAEVITTAFASALADMLAGAATTHVSFMEGPYECTMDARGRDRLRMRFWNDQNEIGAGPMFIDTRHFAHSVVRGASLLEGLCAERGWISDETLNLGRNRHALEKLLEHQGAPP